MTNDYGNLELHTVLFNAMCDFDDFCRKYNLRYCLHGGSCLGAIRHHGFIPWDDDIDIAMLREDYEKLIRIAPLEWGEKYTIQTYKNTPDLLTNVMKIRINNSGFKGNGNQENDEAFLDVFPMSDVPNSKILQKMQNKVVIFFNNVVYAKIGYINPTSIKSKIVFGSLSKLNRVFLGNIIELLIKHFPHGKSKFVNIVATANYNGNTGYAWDLIPKKYFEEIIAVNFEGKQFYITKYWDEYLSSHYGNYMELPPMEKRNNKHGMMKQN